MSNGQTTKYLSNDDDAVYLTMSPLGEMIMVYDKLYASPKLAAKHGGTQTVVLIKQTLIELYEKQTKK